jgi:hypothetical protein
MGGFKQPQHLMTLNYLLSLGAYFDLVMTIDGFNEIAGPTTANIPKQVSPYFPSGWYHIANRMPDTRLLARVGEVAFDRQRREQYARIMLSSTLLRHSAIAQFFWKGYDRMLVSHLALAQKDLEGTAPDAAEAQARRGNDYAYTGDTQLLADLVEEWQRSAELMHTLAISHHIPYMHFLQPNQYFPDTKQFSAEEKRSAVNPGSPYKKWVSEGYPLLQEAGKNLQKEGIDFRDLTGIFHDVTATVFKDDCCHMNAEGNGVMAENVGKAILAQDKKQADAVAVIR